jgi:tetratricopeptide (TPR) repeat protein
LAVLYEEQGKYEKAEPLYKRALIIVEKELGPEHPTVAASLNNLASLYSIQKLYSQARPLLKRALKIWVKTLGPEHPDVATGLENLAQLQRKTDQDEEAVLTERNAAKIRAIIR